VQLQAKRDAQAAAADLIAQSIALGRAYMRVLLQHVEVEAVGLVCEAHSAFADVEWQQGS